MTTLTNEPTSSPKSEAAKGKNARATAEGKSLCLYARVLRVEDRRAAGIAGQVERRRRIVAARVVDEVRPVRSRSRVDHVVRSVDRIRRRDREIRRAEQQARHRAARAVRTLMID